MRALICIAALAVSGCSALGEGGVGGGADNLPNRGFTGYQITADEEGAPIAAIAGVAAASVAAIHVDGQVAVFFVAEIDGVIGVWRQLANSPPSLVLSADLWANPSSCAIALRPDGSYDLALANEAGTEIAIARSADGLSFGTPETLLIADRFSVHAPSLAYTDEGDLRLYYEARDANGAPHIRLFSEAQGEVGAVLSLGEGCFDPDGESIRCWDVAGPGAPDVRLAVDGLGKPIWRMAYTSESGVGFAASRDGIVWSRYPYNPAIVSESLAEPSQILRDGDYVLYLVDREDGKVVTAVSADGVASELF